MGAKITNAKLTIETLVHAGFRSTANALAELVDNSIEAEAMNIRIIAWNKRALITKRTQNNISELAVLDDGTGMNINDLGHCLSLGWGTRLDSREGLGRFGFGLKGSSISQCRLIEVFSWQNGIENCNHVVMDIDKIYDLELEELPDPEPTSLPNRYQKNFGDLIGESGTLVCWKNLVHVDVKKTDALVRRLNNDLCRIYRHFLDDDNTYGTKRDIRVISVDVDDKTDIKEEKLLPNDPLYVLTPQDVVGQKEPLFIKQEDYPIEIETPEGNSTVQVIATVAKPETQLLGGFSQIGKHCGSNTGISFVRACREIDFGDFGFIDSYDPRNRWWGIEVRFEPILDEFFGVTNNKQQVRNIKFFTDSQRVDLNEVADLDNRDFDYYKAKALLEIDHHIQNTVKDLMRLVKTRGEGGRTKTNPKKDATAQVNTEVKKDTTPTKSDIESQQKTEEEKKEELVDLFKRSDSAITDEQAKELAKVTLDHKVDLTHDSWPGKLFLDIKFPANGAVGVLNREHNFYDVFWEHLSNSDDPKALLALKIMLMAYVRAEDEVSRRHNGPYYEDLREHWGRWCHQLLDLAS